MSNALSNPHSNMGKDMVATKNCNKPQVLFDAVKQRSKEGTHKAKAQVGWVQPRTQRLTLQ